MDKNYIKFILAYDYGWVFERMQLACDEAYELAEEIANRIISYAKRNRLTVYYDVLQAYCEDISFNEIWQEMRKTKS